MRRWSVLVAAVVPLVAGCGAGASTTATHVEALSVHRSLGCAGWYEQSGSTLVTHLTFVGPVRTVSISATALDGAPVPTAQRTVPAGTTTTTVRILHASGVIASATATVADGSAGRATCPLVNPH